MVSTGSKPEDFVDPAGVDVAFDNAEEEWESLELRLYPAALEKATKAAGQQSTKVEEESGNLPVGQVTFDECWNNLKSRDLTEERKRVLQQQREIEQQKASQSCFKRGCCPKLCHCCRAKLNADLENEKQTILALTKVPFSDSDQLHLRMLTTLYKACSLSTGAAPKRYGAHWEYIGFQGTDPATDLRGAGIFGLLQLVAFATDAGNQNQVKAIMDLSQDTVQNFPFAIVGINITKSVLTSLKKGRLNRLCKKQNSVIRVVNAMYKGGLCLFYNRWLHGHKTIEDSGFVLQKIEEETTKRPRRLIRIEMDLTKWRQDFKKEQQQETSLTFHAI